MYFKFIIGCYLKLSQQYKFHQMNRVILSVLSEKSHLRKQQIQAISDLCQSRPLQQPWKSQKFPIFPLQINFYLSNPPFNKISMSIPSELRTKIQIFGSKNGNQHFKIEEVNQQKDDFDDFSEGGIVTKFFKESLSYHYLRLKFHRPAQTKNMRNLCKQVGFRAIQVSNIIYFNCKYVCSIRKRLELHPTIFRLLQLYEYKALVLQKQKPTRHTTQLKQKYAKRSNEIEDMIYKKKLNPIHPQQEMTKRFQNEFEQLLEQPMLQEQQLDFSNPVELKSRINQLQRHLAQFYVDRLMSIQANVENYFKKYWNVEIRDIYLRLLSSQQFEDKTKALAQFWSQIKSLVQLPPNIEEATLMFLNYFMEFINDNDIKLGAMKILCLFFKFETVGMKLYHVYRRIMFNLITCLMQQRNSQTYKLAYKAIFLVYSKLPNTVFINELLNPETHSRQQMKLKKLEILQKIILNDEKFNVDKSKDKELIIEFVLDILLIKELTIDQKNSAYNVVAFLASNFGKEQIIGSFDKLNSMLLMNMQKIIDKKLSKLKPNNTGANQQNQDYRTMCDYCGQQNTNFKDQNIYDIHCFKQCRMLTPCQHCSCIVQIPELNKHYLQECQLKNKFKNCENCNDVIFITKEQEHNKKCTKKMFTKCPLCQQKLQSKLKIKEHVLKDGCPNNPRNQR